MSKEGNATMNPAEIKDREQAESLASEIYWKIFLFLDGEQEFTGDDAGKIAYAAQKAAEAKILEILKGDAEY